MTSQRICKIATPPLPLTLPAIMVANARKSSLSAKRGHTTPAADPEERSLAAFNRLIAKAAPRATRETAAALSRFHRGIADQIRRAG